MQRTVYDLEEWLIVFAVNAIKVPEALPNTSVGRHIRGQLSRSGTSSAANYGEAQSAESRADFVHKLKIVLKELRESRVWLLIIRRTGCLRSAAVLEPVIQEVEELIAIFVRSIKTALEGKRSG